ncbi:MAG: MBL fold metallo-hydrolase [Chloroflexi bacterium]|nr:MBL fold metallo-hydrolase [Chloroflexota bacterium]
MPKLVILGTSYSVPDEDHENTHMVLQGKDRLVLIDCVSNPIVRLKKAGLNHSDLTDILMTHYHPDHVSGVPLLLMGMGILNREKHLNIYGLEHVVGIMKKVLVDYQWHSWPRLFQVSFQNLPDRELVPMLETEEFRIFTSPVKHFIPTVGVRIEFIKSGKVLAYSCDTAPTPSVKKLAQDADILIHEAAGASVGHSSATQAGEMAKSANAKELYLIHYPTGDFYDPGIVDAAGEAFGRPVKLAEDFMTFDFD